MLWGNSANTMEIFPIKKDEEFKRQNIFILRASHPSNMGNAKNTRIIVDGIDVDAFIGCRHFSKCNEILEKAGIKPIDWKTDLNIQTTLFS